MRIFCHSSIFKIDVFVGGSLREGVSAGALSCSKGSNEYYLRYQQIRPNNEPFKSFSPLPQGIPENITFLGSWSPYQNIIPLAHPNISL